MLTGCTIVAGNYFALAKVVAESFTKQNLGSRFVVLVVDDTPVCAQGQDFEVWRLDDLNQDEQQLHKMAGIYDVMEFATAVKPWLLLALLAQNPDTPVLYLDPDIAVYRPLDDLADLARSAGIVLTPHTLVPMPRDGLRPNEADVLGSGIYNLGFIGVADQIHTRAFLKFWAERMVRDAIVDQPHMLFTDQRWVDFVPMYPHAVCRDPGCNVAYWNVWGRPIDTDADGHWTAGGAPLKFFHFSGFDPQCPHWLSSHQGDHPRVRLPDHPKLAQLCDEYAQALIAAGHVEQRRAPYGWAATRTGLMLTKAMRRTYRLGLQDAERGGTIAPPGPFDDDGGVAFAEWLTRPVRSGGISALTMGRWEVEPGLQALFPDPKGTMAFALDKFVQANPAPGIATDDVLTLSAKRSPVSAPPPLVREISDDPVDGINLFGYFDAELSVGGVARGLAQALAAVGAAHGCIQVPVGHGATTKSRLPTFTQSLDYDVNLLVINADRIREVFDRLGPAVFSGRHTISQWAWETSQLPESAVAALDLVDEVWVLSNYVADAVRTAGGRAQVITLPVTVPTWTTVRTRADLNLPEGFLVLNVFDWASVAARKNPLGALAAYSRAFAPDSGAHLVIKTQNAQLAPHDVDELRIACSKRPDVHLIDAAIHSVDMTAFLQHADCVLSLHRSEGFGMVLAEAMACGTPCVATAYSGNLDFMDDSVAALVPATLIEVPKSVPIYGGLGEWADPDIDAAAAALQHLRDCPDERVALGKRARARIIERHNTEIAGRSVVHAVAQRRAHIAGGNHD